MKVGLVSSVKFVSQANREHYAENIDPNAPHSGVCKSCLARFLKKKLLLLARFSFIRINSAKK